MFEVGKEVLCIRTHVAKNKRGQLCAPDYIRGKKYLVTGIKRGCCAAPVLLQLENPEHGMVATHCSVCGVDRHGQWYNASNFVPIDNSLSETTVEQLLSEPIEI